MVSRRGGRLQFQGLPVPGDEAIGGEEGQLGTGRGLHPPHDEPWLGLTLISAAPHRQHVLDEIVHGG